MKIYILSAFLLFLISCNTGYPIYLQDQNYKLNPAEEKTEIASFPNHVTVYYRAKISETVKLFVDNQEVIHETISGNQDGYKIYYFSHPKPKTDIVIEINQKKYTIPAYLIEKQRHVYLMDNQIFLSKSPSFNGIDHFEYGKKIKLK